MALTPEQEQQRLELIQRQTAAARELASTYDKMEKTLGRLNADQEEALSISKQITKQASDLDKHIQKRLDKTTKVEDLSKSLSRLEKDFTKNQRDSANIVAKLNSEKAKALGEARKLAQQERDIQVKIRQELALQDALEDKINKLKGKKGAAARAELAAAREDLRSSKEALKIQDKKLNATVKQKEEQKDLTKQLAASVVAHEKTLQEQEQEIELTKKEVAQRKLLQIYNTLSSKFNIDSIKSLTTITGLWTAIVDGAFKADTQITQLGKSLGVSYKSAYAIRQEFVAYSRNTRDSFINTDRLIKAQAELSEQLGIAVQFSGDELANFSRLTEIVGLTAQEASSLVKFSAAAGMESKDYVSNVRVAAFYAQQANKVHISDKELLSTVSKLSAGILTKFQNNPKAIAEAVVQAKKLGTTLEQVDKTADSLLNFESSIGAELEAELITGKQLNFERARAAALTGDQATLMEEMAAQAGSLAEYQDMNVLAQESLAKAFGMSREEMANMLMKQEAVNKYGDEAAKLNAEQLEDMQRRNMTAAEYLEMVDQQRSAQEQFNDLVTKLQDILVNIAAGPLAVMIKGFVDVLDSLGLIYPILGAIGGIIVGKMVGGIIDFGKGLVQALPKLATMVGLSSAKAVAEITAAEAITLGLATVGIIAGIGMAVSAMNSEKSKSASQKVSDGIAPPGQGPFTITNGYGATAITAAGDGLAVSPNIKRGGGDSGVMAAINNLATIMSRPAPSPQFALSVDGQQLGSVVGRQQETGTQQTKNAYRLA
jgi:hypothetical protein